LLKIKPIHVGPVRTAITATLIQVGQLHERAQTAADMQIGTEHQAMHQNVIRVVIEEITFGMLVSLAPLTAE